MTIFILGTGKITNLLESREKETVREWLKNFEQVRTGESIRV